MINIFDLFLKLLDPDPDSESETLSQTVRSCALSYIEYVAEVSVAVLAENLHPLHPVGLVHHPQNIIRLVLLHQSSGWYNIRAGHA